MADAKNNLEQNFSFLNCINSASMALGENCVRRGNFFCFVFWTILNSRQIVSSGSGARPQRFER